MSSQPDDHHASDDYDDLRIYVLRSWFEKNADLEESGHWRFEMRDPQTHQRRYFNSVADLLAHLREVFR